LIVAVFMFCYFLLSQNKTSVWKRTKVILTGLSSSGKTKLFYKLTRNLNIDATTSFTINEKVYEKDEDTFKIVDIPGHATFDRDMINNIEKGTTIIYLMNEEVENMMAESCQRLYEIFITKKFQDLGCEIFIFLVKTPQQSLTPLTLEQEIEKEL
jgi:GTPase SAR1 family protein